MADSPSGIVEKLPPATRSAQFSRSRQRRCVPIKNQEFRAFTSLPDEGWFLIHRGQILSPVSGQGSGRSARILLFRRKLQRMVRSSESGTIPPYLKIYAIYQVVKSTATFNGGHTRTPPRCQHGARAIAASSERMSTGLTRWVKNPLARLRARSSSIP